MVATADKIDTYMNRLRELASQCNHIDRFYLFQDEDLYDLELEIADSSEASAFYHDLFAQYRAWREEIGPEKWQEVLDYNDSLNDANKNFALGEF